MSKRYPIGEMAFMDWLDGSTTWHFRFASRDIQLNVSPKGKKLRVFIDGNEWKRVNPGD